MLGVSASDVVAHGGFLSALAESATHYVSGTVTSTGRYDQNVPPQILVHKEPHLDEYLAAFAYRVSIPADKRAAKFAERGLHWDVDLAAEAEWPQSAVFGMGGGRPEGDLAQVHFDEHMPEGGRKVASCADMVFDDCIVDCSPMLESIRAEVSAIDSSGGAAPLHLANLLKSVHTTRYRYETYSSGRNKAGKIAAHWKRSVVEAIIAAFVFCEQEGIPFQSKTHANLARQEIFDHLETSEPYRSSERAREALNWLRDQSTMGNFKSVSIKIGDAEFQQILVLPAIVSACYHAWGKDVCVFIVSILLEAGAQSQLTYRTTLDLARECWAKPHGQKSVESGPIQIRIWRCKDALEYGKQAAPRHHPNFNPRYQSKLIPISVISCKYTDATPQAHKGLQSFVSQDLHGVGLILMHHIKDSRKAIFKGNSISQELWRRVTRRIQAAEPGLWYLVSDTAPYIINGTASKKSPMSSMHQGMLCRILDEEYSHVRS